MAKDKQGRVPIVGIGASAGGIEALEHFFRAMPATFDAAIVIVTHLNPQRESVLTQILRRYTQLPVETIEHEVRAEAGHVYVMPENASLTIEGGCFKLVRPGGRREPAPVDLFLASLAADLGDRAVGVILSGGDGDGTLGAKAIKEHGGLTLAQAADGTAPKHPSMPQTAIASGMIDFAIPVQDMPDRIVSFVASLDLVEQIISEPATEEFRRIEDRRGEIYGLIKGQLGHDFSGYKTKTFTRRVLRRQQLLQIADLDTYLDRLKQDPTEVAALFRDLLINVTSFFRDADAFEILATDVIPVLFEGKKRDDTVRVWVPGCATGEEVYSIAILLREHLDTLAVRPRVQIFATDIDERSLEVARAARYPLPLMQFVTPERRNRYFTEEGQSYVVNKDVREMCIFSPHSLIRDPPFSRMDLVSCRNLLIYLAPNLQGQVIPLFHYSLRPSGFLFLGSSENVGQYSDLFSVVAKKQRIFKAREMASKAVRLPIIGRRSDGGSGAATGVNPKQLTLQHLRQDIEGRVLERFAPAYVVINADSDIVFYSMRTGKYLEAAPGVPSRALIGMARKGIRLDLRSAIHESVSKGVRVERGGLMLENDDGRFQVLGIIVEPLNLPTEEPLFLVIFADSGPSLDREQAALRILPPIDGGEILQAIEHELVETRDRLQSMIEEYETALEELKSSNEELVSVNEELQSTNEELEASKEELQSLNEELQTVNTELSLKIDEVDAVNSDLRNLFDSSKIASVVVNDDLSIRNFTPLAASIFNLLPGDRGRSLATFTNTLRYPSFLDDLARVLTSGKAFETQVRHLEDEIVYLVRIQRYGEEPHAESGATVTFVDITSLGGKS